MWIHPYLFSGLSQILSFGFAVELVTRVLVKKIQQVCKYMHSFISDRLKHSKIIMDYYVALLSSYSLSGLYDVDGLFVGMIVESILFLL